jgi:hypothetical protein
MDTEELKRLEELVDIWTAYDGIDWMSRFKLRKKEIRRRIASGKQRGGWIELLSGGWSQTMYNQGNVKFQISHSDDKKAWALLSVAFPSRIIAAAESSSPMTVEEVGGLMLRRVQEAGGEYFDEVHDSGDIDLDRLLSIYID